MELGDGDLLRDQTNSSPNLGCNGSGSSEHNKPTVEVFDVWKPAAPSESIKPEGLKP